MHNLSSFMQNNKTLREVLSTLEEGGHTAHLVGGSVRDALLHRASQDFDIATSAHPQQVSDLFASKGFAVHETGIEHGTLTVVTDKIPFEITTWRRDISTDGRRATIAFADNLEDDAMRRDFTINALFADRSGRVLDPTGQGLNDIKNRRVRFIGNAETRIREDHLRILRFFRFNALLGTSIDRDSVDFEECARAAPSVVTLPAERIGAEVIKLLSQPAPAEAMAAMVASGTTRHFLPDLSQSDEKVGTTLRGLQTCENEAGIKAEPMRRLAALLFEPPIQELRLSKAQTKAFRILKGATDAGESLAKLAFRNSAEFAKSVAALRAMQSSAEVHPSQFRIIEHTVLQEFPLKAADLMPALTGPALGAALRQAEDAWIDSDFTLSREDLKDRLSADAA